MSEKIDTSKHTVTISGSDYLELMDKRELKITRYKLDQEKVKRAFETVTPCVSFPLNIDKMVELFKRVADKIESDEPTQEA